MEILVHPNPFLRKKAAPVGDIDDDVRAIVEDMKRTMADNDGLGLAATQVGLDMRLVIIDRYAFEGEAGRDKPVAVFINPEIIERGEASQVGEEGCLSFPGVFIKVERAKYVKVRALDEHGESFEVEGRDLGARALLHELDHLEGVVMVDRVSHLVRSRALKKHARNQRHR